jgi:tRNA (cmo5U34)-methyltransferase
MSTAADYFGSMIDSYDSLIRRAVPRYNEMLQRVIEYLPERATRVMELGCGTGNLSLALAARYPDAEIIFVDASHEMLEVTRERLDAAAAGRQRFSFVPSFFEQLEPAANSLDLVVSSISLHHVKDKGPLYKTIHTALQSGGTFRFADQLRGATEENHALNWSRWLEFCREADHCKEEEVQSLLDHAEAHDFYTPLEEHFGMLRAAGFKQLDCVWRNWIWGIVTAEV